MLTYYNNYVPLVQLKTINMPRQALRGINRQDIFEDDEDYRSESPNLDGKVRPAREDEI